MSEPSKETAVPGHRWVAYTLAVIVPAVLAFIFWQGTPTVGGWGRFAAGDDSNQSAAVDYSQNGRLNNQQIEALAGWLQEQNGGKK